MSSAPQTRIADLLQTCRVIVCCGAGGVGKTTTAAALSVAAARMGRRVLVLTIDPSRRLAQTLGVSRHLRAPTPLSEERLAAAGISAPGSLEAWMLDAKLVSDDSVRRLVPNPEAAERIMQNRIYRHATTIVAGLHEYTAMEALQQFVTTGKYDLVVLDTPPSRNALDFLDAPKRLARFLDGSIFRLFLPREGGVFNRTANALMGRVLRAVFGEEMASELTVFLATFSEIFQSLNADLTEVRQLLAGPDVAFLLVTTPAAAALAEARYFQARILELQLPFRGLVLNRSRAAGDGMVFPTEAVLPLDAPPLARQALQKLQALARVEQLHAASEQGLVAELCLRAGEGATVVPVPNLPLGADDLGTLLTVAERLASA